MTAVQHVFKRGSVYWWRRRLPIGTGRHDWVRLELSLDTKELERARRIAPEVTLASHRLQADLKTKMIPADVARQILIQVAREKSDWLDAIKSGSAGSAESNRRGETASGWAYRLLAAQGRDAVIGPTEERDLRNAGLDDDLIAMTRSALKFYQENNFARVGKKYLEGLLEQYGIRPSSMDLAYAESLYLRGHAAALLNTQRRWSGVREDDLAVIQEAFATAPVANAPVANAPVAPAPSMHAARPASIPEGRPRFPPDTWRPPAQNPTLPVSATPDAVNKDVLDEEDDVDLYEEHDVECELMAETVEREGRLEFTSGPGLVEIVTQAAGERIATKEWRKGQDRQHISIAKLFVRFIGHDQPERMRQSDIARFKSLLFQLPKNHGKSPKDHQLPISALVARAKELPPEDVGLSPATLNRYMTQMGNIVDICKHAGYPFGNFEGVMGLRARRKGDVRNERGKFKTDELKTLFALPVWRGCASSNERLAGGERIFHDATYWVPLLSIYNGGRREENCGLLLDEIEVEGDHPCFRFENNRLRLLKTPQSKRRVPIHPELIRLGFLEYVEALRAAEHKLLFPDLPTPGGSTPMGDVFDDSWQKMRAAALPNAKDEGKVLHSLRHWCNNEMKQRGIRSEIRKDILGHTNGDMNEGRYTDPALLQVMADAMSVLPLPTAELSPHPIELIPQVIEHKPRPSRKKRQTAAA